VLLPGCFCVALAVVALARGARSPAVWALLANALLFVVFLPAAAYEGYASAGRISTSVFLAFLLSLPALTRVFPTTRAWMWLPTVAWFAPWYELLPLALGANWG
jgi:heme/copper-type cytochrome/quinol oxidase subunit 3